MTTTTMQLSGQRRVSGRPRGRRPGTPRRTWVAPVVRMAVLALVFALIGAAALTRHSVPSTASTTTVRVSPSDTLWSIARANRLAGASTAETVQAIARANGLRGAPITPGTVLQVPRADTAPATLAQADGAPGAP